MSAESPWHTIVTAVVRDATGERILLAQGEAGHALPHVRLDAYQWVAESEAVVETFAEGLGFRPWILRAMRFEEAADRRQVVLTVVLEHPPAAWAPPADLAWQRLDDPGPLTDPAETALLATLRAEQAHGAPTHRRP